MRTNNRDRCPFCGTKTITVVDYYLKNVGRSNFRCKCTKCHTEGPASTTNEGAVRKWRARSDDGDRYAEKLSLIEDIEQLLKLKKKVCSLFKDIANYTVEDAVLEYETTSDYIGGFSVHFCGKQNEGSGDENCTCKLCSEITRLVNKIYTREENDSTTD